MLLFPVRFFIQQLIIICLADRICHHVGARVPRVFPVSRAYRACYMNIARAHLVLPSSSRVSRVSPFCCGASETQKSQTETTSFTDIEPRMLLVTRQK